MRTAYSPCLAVATPEEVRVLRTHATLNSSRMAPAMLLASANRAGALVDYYDKWCRLAGIDTVLAITQTWHETKFWSSWWYQAPRRNPAGIGVNGKVLPLPVPLQQWQKRDDGRWAKGYAFPTYATGVLHQIHGLAKWCGGNAEPLAAELAKYGLKKPYTPPKKALGSCTEWRHLGWRHNPKQIGWAHPGDLYGHNMAVNINKVLERSDRG